MSHKKIMIVDDDKEFLWELKEALKLNGYEITSVNNSALALDVAMMWKPDVILLDLKMPGKSGFLLADELRNSPALADLPIIAMSGNFKEEESDFFKIYGITGYIGKPFIPSDVILKIEEALCAAKVAHKK